MQPVVRPLWEHQHDLETPSGSFDPDRAAAGRSSRIPLTAMIPAATRAAQSSADSLPGTPPTRAPAILTNAAAEETASLQWCPASAATAVLPVSCPTAASGSALSCPYGWSGSGGFAATRRPRQTMSDEKTSVDESTASSPKA
jgi:hypothetical protein